MGGGAAGGGGWGEDSVSLSMRRWSCHEGLYFSCLSACNGGLLRAFRVCVRECVWSVSVRMSVSVFGFGQ
jgi:hypothetical protein